MKTRYHRFLCVLCIASILFVSADFLPASAENERILDTLTTFYNENVTYNYTISSNGNSVIPLDIVSQGDVTIKITYPEIATDYFCKVYTDDSYINMVHSSIVSTTESSHTIELTAGAKEMLYLYLSTSNPKATVTDYSFTISANLTPAKTISTTSGKTLKNKRWTQKKVASAKRKQYYKLILKGSRYFNINSNNKYIKVQLFQKDKKKKLSNPVELKSSNNFQASFSLGKGTYYIMVTSGYSTSYQLYYKENKVAKVYGSEFKNAKSMIFSKQYLGLVKATSKTDDGQYYKFKLSKSQRIQIAFYVENSSGKFMLELFDAAKNPLPTSNYKLGNASLLYINSKAAIPKGTYYMKVTKANKLSSGCYSLMVRTQS